MLLPIELSNRLSASISELGEKDARIDELENDLKEARGSSIGLYGTSKEYLEKENLRLAIKLEEMEEEIKMLRSKERRNSYVGVGSHFHNSNSLSIL